MSAARELLADLLASRLQERGSRWLDDARAEISRGVDPQRFCELVSLASRHVGREKLAPRPEEIARASVAVEGWNPERWSVLEAVRAMLVLAREDLEQPEASEALEEAFRYADVGELTALHRSLQLLPMPERYTWRAGEGCRSSMSAVFEAAACDTGFPAKNFSALAWRQLVIKALFVEAPLWRIHGLDARLDPELARMALDLADERTSAGRPVQPDLWLCLGRYAGDRGLASIERELAQGSTLGKRAAAIALARAARNGRLEELREGERDPAVAATMQRALEGHIRQTAFRDLDPREAQVPR